MFETTTFLMKMILLCTFIYSFLLNRDHRLTISNAYQLVYGFESSKKSSDVDVKVELLKDVCTQMGQNYRLKLFQMNKHLIEDTRDFFNNLEAMQDLRKHIGK